MIGYRGATEKTAAGYAILQVYRMLRHATDDALRQVGLTTPQWAVLGCLAKAECLSGADMARIHHVTPQTMNTILHNLLQSDLIVREHHPTNGTVLLTRLTPQGRERFEEATRRVEAVQTQMMSALDEPERDTLVALLSRCMDGLRAGGIPDDVGCPD
ncbi:MAG TPA: MarR family transcriptional regulator [Chloroflexota bacterium]|nr:MarR family transcriptional regulator [Chloroflexota bacterium]